MALVAGWWHGVGCVAFTLLSVAFQVGIQMSNMNGRVHGPSCCSDIHPKGSGHVERDFFFFISKLLPLFYLMQCIGFLVVERGNCSWLASLPWREPQPAKPWDYLQQPQERLLVWL